MYVTHNFGSVTGSNMFILIWSVLPTLYVIYFGCLYILSPRSPFKNIQRGLLLFGMFHFLFLTDVVAYAYGRGYSTPQSELIHWSERWAWRVAIIVPIYQNCTNGHWINGHSFKKLGRMLRFVMAFWCSCFILQQVIFSDVGRFIEFLTGWEVSTDPSYTSWYRFRLFSYHGAINFMWIMYALMMIGGFSTYKVFVNSVSPNSYTRVPAYNQV